MVKHIDRKSNEIVFMKCSDPLCPHCSKNPVQCRQIWSFLKEREFKWWNPEQSKTHPEHFSTFLEMCELDSGALATGIICNFSLNL